MTATPPPIDREFALHLLSDLVRINSVNPMASQEGTPGRDSDRPGEKEAAARFAGALEDLGARVEVTPSAKAGEHADLRPNVMARWAWAPAGDSAPEIVLCSHLDTVEATGMDAPFEPTLREGMMYGRGSLDAKGQLVMFAAAIEAAQKLDPPPSVNVTLAAVSDEEDQSVGARSVLANLRGDACIIGEPTGLDLVIAHKGFFWVEVETRGKAVHGSVPEEGIDAIAKMADVIRAMEDLKPEFRKRLHPLLDYPRIHMGVIQGGTGVSTVPDHCRLTLEVRTCLRQEAVALFASIQEAVYRLAEGDPDLKAEARQGVIRYPMEIDPNHPLVSALSTAVQEEVGRAPARNVMGAWTDAAYFAEKMPTLIFGPGDLGLAHSKDESVPVEEITAGAGAILRFLMTPPTWDPIEHEREEKPR